MIPKTTLLQTFDDNLTKSDNVSFASCSQDMTRLSKSVKESMRSPLHVVASKSTSFETVVTVDTGSYRRRRSRHASNPSGSAALSTNRCAHPLVNMIAPGPALNVFVDFCQRTTKKSSRPTAKNSTPISPLVVLAFERLRLVLRRKRADPLLLCFVA